MTDNATRAQIVEAADRLFYRQGFEHTSFSDIAEDVQISRGNFYYYFKTKDEILGAVIARRLADRRDLLAQWEAEADSPAARIRCYIDILIANKADIKRYGCPLGTLTSELAKLNHGAQGEAKGLFTVFRTWLRRQFELAGCGGEADALALHVVARSQGVATLANAFGDEKFIRREVQDLHDWLDARLAEAASATGARRNRKQEI